MKKENFDILMAQYVLYNLKKIDIRINIHDLQRVLFILDYSFFQKREEALFSEEFKAFSYGPVLVGVNRFYRGRGSSILPIQKSNFKRLKKEKRLFVKRELKSLMPKKQYSYKHSLWLRNYCRMLSKRGWSKSYFPGLEMPIKREDY